jgi:chromosome segregation protein
LENSLKEVRNSKNYLLERKKEYEDLLTRQQSFKEDLQFKIDKLVSKIHQNEIEATRLNENIRSLFSKALEVYNTNLNDVSFEFVEGFSPEQVEGEVERLKKSLVNLGNVNFLALQEYEEQKQRLELYRKQIEDLTNSENSLKEALDEINRTAVERFLTAFDQINVNFSKVFAELFGGDSFAELVIDRNDPLESDVEIRVKPAGKKINSIDTLSQGEKTLTVLSLLFALYLVKPSPFCVLDEVDAPLDDANVDRFLNLLRKFSDVQFILITHNKRTMEFANVLYGITMAEDGVSKVLSVKLVE